MAKEARLRRSEAGLVPENEGWFVVNARQARWKTGQFGSFTPFEGDDRGRFEGLGINVGVLEPGQPSSFYHGEAGQEDFLVLSGECVLIIEGEERRLRAWDFVHCPPWTNHVFVGAGDGPCVLLGVGVRVPGGGIVYAKSEVARRYGAGVSKETRDPDQAYAGIADDVDISFSEEWLAGLDPERAQDPSRPLDPSHAPLPSATNP